MDFKYKKSGTIFNMHSYWTKQPIDPIMFLIEKNTKAGDVILDPFCGTGMTGVAAILRSRKVILNDLSTVSVHISKGYCQNYHVEKKLSNYIEEKNRILKKIDDYYTTECEHCGNKALIRFSIVGEVWQSKDGLYEENRGEILLKNKAGTKFKKDNFFKEFRLLKICYECSCAKNKQFKLPSKKDIKKWKTEDYKKHFYPKDDFFGQEPKRNYKKGVKKVYQLYSNRNLTALSIIFEEINKIKNKETKQLFTFIFTSILFNSSLMSRYRDYENTSIKMGTFYIPPLIKDTNVSSNFENKFNIILKGNSEIFKNDYPYVTNFIKGSADNLPNIESNSIDYIYTDPPYSDILNYAELNIVYESWLGSKTNFENEMIVSKHQGKDIKNYAHKFRKFLDEAHRILKEGSVLTLVFHHPNLEHWEYLQQAILSSKFDPIISNLPIRLISNSKTSSQHATNKNSQCFLVFNFRKNKTKKNITLSDLTQEITKQITEEAKKAGYKNNSDIFDYLMNRFLFEYKIKPFIL